MSSPALPHLFTCLRRKKLYPHEAKSLESNGCTTFPGQVKDIFYQGDFSELTITLKNVQRELSIHMARGISHDKELCAGLDVIVYWKRAHNNVLISE